jgi:hypothetical protein
MRGILFPRVFDAGYVCFLVMLCLCDLNDNIYASKLFLPWYLCFILHIFTYPLCFRFLSLFQNLF